MAKVFKRHRVEDEPIPVGRTVIVWSIRSWGPALAEKLPTGKLVIAIDTLDELDEATHWAPLDPLHTDIDIMTATGQNK